MREPWRAAVHEIAEQATEQFEIRWKSSPARPAAPDAMAAVFTWMMERRCHQLITDDTSADTIALAMSEIIWHPHPQRANHSAELHGRPVGRPSTRTPTKISGRPFYLVAGAVVAGAV